MKKNKPKQLPKQDKRNWTKINLNKVGLKRTKKQLFENIHHLHLIVNSWWIWLHGNFQWLRKQSWRYFGSIQLFNDIILCWLWVKSMKEGFKRSLREEKKTFFPQEKDCGFVDRSDIRMKLPAPDIIGATARSASVLTFSVDFLSFIKLFIKMTWLNLFKTFSG